MTHHSTGADDLVYDLVSIQYHALKGAQLYDRFERDATGHPDVLSFIEQVRADDVRRAQRCHELLRDLTRDGLAHDGDLNGATAAGSAPEGAAANARSGAAVTDEPGATAAGVAPGSEDDRPEGYGGA